MVCAFHTGNKSQRAVKGLQGIDLIYRWRGLDIMIPLKFISSDASPVSDYFRPLQVICVKYVHFLPPQ